ncbi:MAG TPA: HAMP domain-containing protein, partial [Sediminispirochaeta sp.]|nr:HAMP domain-containing protein [Sediminispirochaeta sp.]
MKTKLQGKIALVQVLVVFLVMGIMGYINYNDSKNGIFGKMEEESANILARLSNALAVPMWNYDKQEGAKLLSIELLNEDIIAVAVEQEGELWLAMMDNGEEEASEVASLEELDQEIGDVYMKKEAPVMHGEDELGLLRLYYTDTAAMRELRGEMRQIVFTTVLMGVILTLAISVVLHFMVIKPIKNILRRLRDIAEGEADLTKTIEVLSKDEIGEFVGYFNQFIHSLRELAVNIKESGRKSLVTGHNVQQQSENAGQASE